MRDVSVRSLINNSKFQFNIVEREKEEKPYSHSSVFYLQLRDIYIQG